MIKGSGSGGRKSSKIRISVKLFLLFPVILMCCVFSHMVLPDGKISSERTKESTMPDEGSGQSDRAVIIPQCESQPWKQGEDLIGSCPGGMKPHKLESQQAGPSDASLIRQCAEECCKSDCITWQYRRDVGCLHGGDVRLGQEKDGVSAWCSDHAPRRWQGQYVLKRGNGKVLADREATGACNLDTWNPNEQPGQCFGLGDVKKDAGGNAQACMEACCRTDDCGAWQWQQDLGCFYHKRMHGCVDVTDPIVFEPFVGRRKLQSSRTYTDKKGQPWSMKLDVSLGVDLDLERRHD